jgi:hypothetical protein
MIRRSSTINTKRIDHIYDSIKLHYGIWQILFV